MRLKEFRDCLTRPEAGPVSPFCTDSVTMIRNRQQRLCRRARCGPLSPPRSHTGQTRAGRGQPRSGPVVRAPAGPGLDKFTRLHPYRGLAGVRGAPGCPGERAENGRQTDTRPDAAEARTVSSLLGRRAGRQTRPDAACQGGAGARFHYGESLGPQPSMIFRASSRYASMIYGTPVTRVHSSVREARSPLCTSPTFHLRAPAMSCCRPTRIFSTPL